MGFEAQRRRERGAEEWGQILSAQLDFDALIQLGLPVEEIYSPEVVGIILANNGGPVRAANPANPESG